MRTCADLKKSTWRTVSVQVGLIPSKKIQNAPIVRVIAIHSKHAGCARAHPNTLTRTGLSHCGQGGDRKTIVAIVNLLHDQDHHVRRFALDALERLIPMHNARDFDGRKEVIQALGHM